MKELPDDTTRQLFEAYKTERNKAYRKLINGCFAVVSVFFCILIPFMCIFYSSAKPLFLLFVFLVELVAHPIITNVLETKDSPDEYYHSGGLLYISFSQFIEEEKRK